MPTICGYNSGQHMYVDASDGCITINIDVDTGSNQDRSWQIKVKLRLLDAYHLFKSPSKFKV